MNREEYEIGRYKKKVEEMGKVISGLREEIEGYKELQAVYNGLISVMLERLYGSRITEITFTEVKKAIKRPKVNIRADIKNKKYIISKRKLKRK